MRVGGQEPLDIVLLALGLNWLAYDITTGTALTDLQHFSTSPLVR